MYKALRNYINYMTAWQAENFPTLPTKTVFNIVEHLMYCNGNGTHWLDVERGNDHLIMQTELQLDGIGGWIDFPFCDDETKSYVYSKANEQHHSYYSQYEHFLNGRVVDLALEINPTLRTMDLKNPEFWVKAVRENYEQVLAEARSW